MTRKGVRIAVTESEITRALLRTKRAQSGPLVTTVEYRPEVDLDLLILNLSNGRRFVIPREDIQELESARKEQISRIEILGGGTGLHWPALDVDLYVPSALQGVYGNKRWIAKIGRKGGLATSPDKKKASRANGQV